MRNRAWQTTLALVCWHTAICAVAGRAEVCPITSVGLDTSRATTSAGVILGESVIQTFRTPPTQTRIHSITVWRVASQYTNTWDAHLYIGEVDSTGRPVAWPVLLDGPTVEGLRGDGVHPTPFRFEFDPSFVLPHPGKYFFAVQARACAGFWDLQATWDDPGTYAEGEVWDGSRTGCDWVGFPTPPQGRGGDLIFTIEFCATTVCAHADEGEVATLTCPEGYVLGSIDFASYGNPTDSCGDFTRNDCDSPRSREVVEARCLGQPGCSVPASAELFGDPCPGTPKQLVIQATWRGVGPDLTVSRLEVPHQTGFSVPVTYTVVNRTSFPTGAFSTTIKLSTDANIEDDDPVLWSRRDPGVAPGDSLTIDTVIALPPEPRGEIHLGLIVDSGSDVVEQVEVNNRRLVPFDYAAPRIVSVSDVPNDEGSRVALHLLASPDDQPGSTVPIRAYEVYRRNSAAPWERVTSLEAGNKAEYDLVVPTVVDSTTAVEPWRSSFFVRAVTNDSTIFFDSLPDSGYSIDNLAPAAPRGFAASYLARGVALRWGRNREPDLSSYRLYKVKGVNDPPSANNLIASETDTSHFDANADIFSLYRLTAVDVHGNESHATAMRFSGSLRFDLLGAHPNPATAGVVVVEFMLENWRPVRLELHDVAGRRVDARDVGGLGPGMHAVPLGGRLPAGLYFVRLVRGDEVLSTKVALVSRR